MTTCEQCGASFDRSGPRQLNRRYCSEACRQKAYRARRASDRYSLEDIVWAFGCTTIPVGTADTIIDLLTGLKKND